MALIRIESRQDTVVISFARPPANAFNLELAEELQARLDALAAQIPAGGVVVTGELLKQLPLNFVGNVEGRDLYNGKVDVIVADGFVGNVALKISEGRVAGSYPRGVLGCGFAPGGGRTLAS